MSSGLPCGCSEWEHELYEGSGLEDENGCPPPSPPQRCCGASPDVEWTRKLCSANQCTEFYCVCGKFEMSMGPVYCPCQGGDGDE